MRRLVPHRAEAKIPSKQVSATKIAEILKHINAATRSDNITPWIPLDARQALIGHVEDFATRLVRARGTPEPKEERCRFVQCGVSKGFFASWMQIFSSCPIETFYSISNAFIRAWKTAGDWPLLAVSRGILAYNTRINAKRPAGHKALVSTRLMCDV